MLLLVGLGNPGAEYARHRHNVGFMAADAIAERHGFSEERRKFKGMLREGRLGHEKTLILKPQTFMNLSGEAVAEVVNFYKLVPQDVVVLHDELDLAPAKVRVKTGGGHAGHNGLRSISASPTGTDFRRVRIGIGHPGHKARVNGHVLGNFAADDQDWLRPMLERMAEHAPLLAAGDDKGFAARVANSQEGGAKPKAGKPKAKTITPEAPAQPKALEMPQDSKGGPMADMLKRLLGSRR